ncbi:MAG TPA: ribonuclease III [Thermotogota bacterium]|nr:ribonuclease III [Thermotogota bacterium]HPJ89547.1 ribonuclease III [Thermotogota bacterium]HPR95768.1 ribonuclease III [Thermotogota bacterium]
MEEFQKKLGIRFNNTELLFQALRHSSYVNEISRFKNNTLLSNERLEFLGDSVVGIVIVERLYNQFTKNVEGDLARAKSVLASEAILSKIARKISLGDYIFLGHGETLSGGRDRDSLLADAFEALCGAIYLDLGFDVARDFIIEGIYEYIDVVMRDSLMLDYKTKLQEITQSKMKSLPEYNLVSTRGPSHDPEFIIECLIDGRRYGKGRGKSKKEAEQMSAKSAIDEMKKESLI